MSSSTSSVRTWSPLIAAFFLPVVLLVPFANKAFHIDDTVYLWVAQHILEDPLGFYDFEINWYGFDQPVWEINQNPPAMSYVLALIGWIAGWGEIPMHLGTLFFAALVSCGTFFLAREFTTRPWVAVGAMVATPAFLVSSNTVMTDIPMVACYVWAVALWVRGIRKDRWGLLVAASVLMTLGIGFKYFAISLVPLLLVYTLVERKRPGYWLIFLVIPVVGVLLYDQLTLALFGKALFFGATEYAREAPLELGLFRPWVRISESLVFMGGGFASIALLAPILWGKRSWIVGGVVFIVTALAVWGLRADVLYMPVESESRTFWIGVHYVVFLVAGLHIIALTLSDLINRRDSASVLLTCWVFGTLLFAAYFNWAVNIRSVLPMIPAVAILAARRLDTMTDSESHNMSIREMVPLGMAVSLALCVVWADALEANASKRAAIHYAQLDSKMESRFFYEGHWGFQYYADRAGLTYFTPISGSEARPKDYIVSPVYRSVKVDYASHLARIDPELSRAFPVCGWLSTLDPRMGTGFYSHTVGPLPYAFGPTLPIEFKAYRLDIYK